MKRQSGNRPNKMTQEQVANAKKYICANAVVSSVVGTAVTKMMGPSQMARPAPTHLFDPMITTMEQKLSKVTHTKRKIGYLDLILL